MATADVNAFFDRVDSDPDFAQSLAAVRDDSAAVQALIAKAGFVVTPDEMRDAFLDRFGDQLDESQLAAIAGGLTDEQTSIVAGVTLSAAGIGVAVGAAAAGAI